VNSYAANLFGYSRKDALKKRINDFMPKIFAEHHDAYLQKFTANRNKSVNTD
jgi:PAS domain S-box-containing protein